MSTQLKKQPASAIIFLLLGMTIFGSGTPVSKLVTDGFPPFLASELRILISAIILLPVVLKHRQDIRQMDKKAWTLVSLIALIGLVAFSVFMLFGMKEISGVAGSIVMSTTPAVTAALSFLFFRDSFDWRKGAAITLAVLGVLALHLGNQGKGSDSGNLLLGSLLIFGAVCSEAGYTLLGKGASKKLDPLPLVGLASIIGVVLFLPLAIYDAQNFHWGAVSMKGWLALGWWGIGTMALGSVLWYVGVSRVSGSTAAAFMGVMPVSALVLSYVLLGEEFRWIHLLGFTLVFTGVLLISAAHRKEAEHNS